jgi:hypothetical protein
VRVDAATGEFSGAFVDLSSLSPVRTGDVLEMTVLDSSHVAVCEPVEYVLTADDIERRYAAFDVSIPLGSGIPGLLPRVTVLFQNSPNPFTELTRIRYHLAKRGDVSLKIYNVSGQLVRTVVDGSLDPGRYTFDWDCRNDRSRRVAPGAYFCRMSAPGYEMTKKILLIK